mgnify:CR=1 FL=1
MRRARARLVRAVESVQHAKLSGAVGTLAHLEPATEVAVLARLGLTPEPVATQVVCRDRHAALLATLAVLGGTLERIATEVRHLQRSEVREAGEPFGARQQGSSAMPHKRNPVRCERVCGLARLLRGQALAALEDQALWHERDISHSSVERVILPDSFIALDHVLRRFAKIVRKMVVYPERMRENLERSRGVVVLLSDKETGELNCTACMLCMRACPTGAIVIDAPRDEAKKRHLQTCSICIVVVIGIRR